MELGIEFCVFEIFDDNSIAGCSGMPRCKAPDIQTSEAYFLYTATRKDEGNAADGRY
jgi:hypothetical protein